MCATRVLAVAVLGCLLRWAIASPTVHAAENNWPEGDIIAENSQSPNERYGVVIPNRETGADLDEEKIINQLVDLKTHKRLCVIRSARYFEGKNHHGLKIKWALDSSWCVVTYEDRYGFGSITLVEIAGSKCIQSDLGGKIQKSMDAVISRESHKVQTDGYSDAFFRQGPKRTVLVRGTAYTNPKMFEDQPTNHACFEGTFDLATHQWTHSSAAGLDDWDSLTAALVDQDEPTEGTDEEKLKWFDDRLNEVYKAVRAVLPAKRFVAVKNEQRDWLKQLEAQKSPAEKIKLMRPRIAQLRDLLW